MPRDSKKRLEEAKVLSTTFKTINSKSKGKKLKSTLTKLNDTETEFSCNNISENLKTSHSSDSIIYVGSYKLNENYSIIDLTESMASVESEDSCTSPKYVYSPNYYTFYKTLARNSNVTSTTSMSCLLNSIEGTKLPRVQNAKSTSCLTKIDENKNLDIHNAMRLTNRTKENHTDKSTELVEDLDIIKHSLEIEDDINILKLCSPHLIITDNTSVKSLMKTYNVVGTDQFS